MTSYKWRYKYNESYSVYNIIQNNQTFSLFTYITIILLRYTYVDMFIVLLMNSGSCFCFLILRVEDIYFRFQWNWDLSRPKKYIYWWHCLHFCITKRWCRFETSTLSLRITAYASLNVPMVQDMYMCWRIFLLCQRILAQSQSWYIVVWKWLTEWI